MKVTNEQISAVMAELGRRNAGRPKAMTPLERAQRVRAGRSSAAKRRAGARQLAHPKNQKKQESI